MIEGLEICFKCSNSRFGSQNLLQLNWTVFSIDKNILQAKRNTYQEIRYCDYCLALWTGPFEKIELFLMFLNSIDSNLQFTIDVCGNELCFLDLKLILRDNKIQTTVNSKPSDNHLYLQANSFHHLPYFRNTKRGCFRIMHNLFSRWGI